MATSIEGMIEELRSSDNNYALEIAIVNLRPHLAEIAEDQKRDVADLIGEKLESFPMLKKSVRKIATNIINQLTTQFVVLLEPKIDWSHSSVVHGDAVSHNSSEVLPPKSSNPNPKRPA